MNGFRFFVNAYNVPFHASVDLRKLRLTERSNLQQLVKTGTYTSTGNTP